MEEILPKITVAKNSIVVYLHAKIKETEDLLEDIQDAFEAIDAANDYLEADNKPTIPPPDLGYSFTSTTSSSSTSSTTPSSGSNDIAVVISS